MAKKKNKGNKTLPVNTPKNPIKPPKAQGFIAPMQGALPAWAKAGASPSAPKVKLSDGLQSEYDDASTPGQAGTPGTFTDPFKTAGDMFNENEFQTGIDQQIQSAKTNFQTILGENRFQQGQVNQGAQRQSQATDWNAAARGIFRSGIRANSLNDIEANRSQQFNRLQDQISNAQTQNIALFGAGGNGLNADGTPDNSIIGQAIARFRAAMNQRMVENAQQLNTPGTPEVAAAPPPKEWFVSKLTSHLSVEDRKQLRAKAVELGYAKWLDPKKGTIAWT